MFFRRENILISTLFWVYVYLLLLRCYGEKFKYFRNNLIMMSFRYKYFGIPKTLDEFVKKSMKKYYANVDVIVTYNANFKNGGSVSINHGDYSCLVELKTKNMNFKIEDKTFSEKIYDVAELINDDFILANNHQKKEFLVIALEYVRLGIALKYAYQLSNKGLIPKIDGEYIGSAKYSYNFNKENVNNFKKKKYLDLKN